MISPLRPNAQVAAATQGAIHVRDGTIIPADIRVWAAGVKAADFLNGIGGLENSRTNQLLVRDTLQTTLDDSIFAIGDCAGYS